jgi:osmotically-inducible protein OsmY
MRTLVLAGLLCALPMAGFSQAPAPDNTKSNKQANPTADQQSNKQSDAELTRNVRRAIMDDKSLSTDAQNVKVISQNGHVTLQGPVKSEEEKQAVASKAAEVAGQDNVVNMLTVAPH